TYKYDDDNRRIEKSINGQVTRYFYDGDSINPLYETDGSGNVLRQYVYSTSGMRLAMKAKGQTLYYHYNPRGDVVAMTNQDKEVVATYEYDSWGNVLKSDAKGIAADNPFGYAGYMYDKEIGMYYLIARYYNPDHGVFLSIDPEPGDADDPVTQNGYTYVDNNPVMLIDPDGNIPIVPVVVVGARIAAPHVARYAAKKLGKKGGHYVYRYARGRSFEKKVLKELGLQKNTKTVNGRIPDSLSKGRITEIKDVRKVSKTQQFRDYGNTGKPIDLIVSRHSKVSKPLKKLIENSKGTIKVRHGKNKYYTYNK
ncbi:RHS repeat-associated core domain-containing protein, partial [Bacillus mobilis]|uniref:RHS repeat-associated core domain-containing protein n=1 Tax=Bacillus mobilis TaxID=2026190 RepID=UPI0022E12744